MRARPVVSFVVVLSLTRMEPPDSLNRRLSRQAYDESRTDPGFALYFKRSRMRFDQLPRKPQSDAESTAPDRRSRLCKAVENTLLVLGHDADTGPVRALRLQPRALRARTIVYEPARAARRRAHDA